jgi:hypothetical protein
VKIEVFSLLCVWVRHIMRISERHDTVWSGSPFCMGARADGAEGGHEGGRGLVGSGAAVRLSPDSADAAAAQPAVASGLSFRSLWTASGGMYKWAVRP